MVSCVLKLGDQINLFILELLLPDSLHGKETSKKKKSSHLIEQLIKSTF